MTGVVVSGTLTGRDGLGGRGGRVLGAVLQPLHHLPLNGRTHGLGRRGPQLVRGPLELVLAGRVARRAGALLGRLHHLGGGVRQCLGGGQQAFLERKKKMLTGIEKGEVGETS